MSSRTRGAGTEGLFDRKRVQTTRKFFILRQHAQTLFVVVRECRQHTALQLDMLYNGLVSSRRLGTQERLITIG